MNTLVPNVPPDNENWYVLGSGYGPPSIRGILGLLPAPSGFALSSDDAHDENCYDLGSGCAPPHQRCLGPARGPPPTLHCVLMMLAMKICTIWALGVPYQRCLGPAPGPPPTLHCVLMMLMMKIGAIWALGVPPIRDVLGLLLAPLRIGTVFC